MTFNTIGFVGLGLIGGSVAKSIKRVHPEITIVGYNRNQDVLRAAVRDGVVDIKSDESLKAFRECDLIFLCVPVVTALDFMDRLRNIKKEGAILTDVGSVKTGIHRYVEETGLTDCFIGGHPMAGSEKTGYMSSSAGALPLVMTYEEQDHVTAAISHLPHVISASLVNLVHDQDGPEHYMKLIAAGGFRDITRISSSSPQMWQEICLDNPDNICAMMDAYISKLIDYRLAIRNENADELLSIFTQCKDYRDSFDTEPKGSLPGEYRIYVDIADEPGAIAQIATMLAMHNISIKNIGIVHNREFEQGVLRIVFYDSDAKEEGVSVLEDRNYYVYKE